MGWFVSLRRKLTASPLTGLPWASVTAAVAMVRETPSATIELGWRATLTFAAGPATWVSVAWSLRVDVAELSVAVIVTWPAVVELVIVAE
jgi:hypothetical protein